MLQVEPHQKRAEGQNPRSAAHVASEANQDAAGFLGWKCTLVAHGQFLIHRNPQVFVYRAALKDFSQFLLMPGPTAFTLFQKATGLSSNAMLASTTCLLCTIANLLRQSASWSCKESPRVAWVVHRTDLRTQTAIKVCHTNLSKSVHHSAIFVMEDKVWLDRWSRKRKKPIFVWKTPMSLFRTNILVEDCK